MLTSSGIALSIVLATLSVASVEVAAQDYVTRKYATTAQLHVIYGTAQGFAGTTDTLRLNYYKPVADGNRRRPLAIWVHGGGFTGGSRGDFDVLALAYAERGWASATISYRLGFYPAPGLAYPNAYDTAEVVRANYRAAQDLWGAIRFILARAESDSIDPTFVVIGGGSAGGMTCLQAAYVDDTERYPATRGATDVPGVVSPGRPDLGPATGMLHTDIPNPRILAVVNMFGAIQDTNFINSVDDPALYQYHQTGDPIVACRYDQAFWSYPGVPDNYFLMHGSCDIKRRVENLGYSAARHRSWIHEGPIHGFHDPIGLDADIARWLAPLVKQTLTSVEDDNDGYGNRANGDKNGYGYSADDDDNNAFTAMYGSEDLAFEIFDVTGRKLLAGIRAPGDNSFENLSGTLPPGAYYMRLGVQTRLFMVHR